MPQTQEKARKMVPVWNAADHLIDIGIRVREAMSPGRGATVRMIRFLPGNNEISMEDLEACQKHPLWKNYVDKLQHRDLTGRQIKYAKLEVGKHDEDFEVESEELGTRMYDLKRKRAGKAA